MPNLTVRNIPERTMKALRTASKVERRSVNSEVLVLLEEGLSEKTASVCHEAPMSRSAQLAVWRSLCGSWVDSRSSTEIIADIVEHRTHGREVVL